MNTIADEGQLQWLWENQAYPLLTYSYILGQDMAMDSVGSCTWNMGLGTYSSPGNKITGTFDGGGYVVSGLAINDGGVAVDGFGFIGAVSSTGTVQNLGFSGSVTSTASGATKIGGLVGLVEGSVTSSYMSGAVSGSDIVGSVAAVVYSGGSISNSYSTGGVTSTNGTANSSAGGLVGNINSGGSVSDSYAIGSVTGNGASTGGVVGAAFSTGRISDLVWGNVASPTEATQCIGDLTDPACTEENSAGMTTYATFSSIWDISDGYNVSNTWGICSGVNSGYPFLTAFYSTNPCTPSSPTPTFDTPVPTADGFTVNVTNYDLNYTWTPTVTTGSVSAGTATGSTLPLTVTGLSAGVSDTITVTTSRSGYTNASATVTSAAISNALTPTFDTPVATSGGFTVNVTNYDALYTWTPTVTTGSVSAGTASGSTLPLTVTGLSAGASATITMTTTRSGYANGTGTVTGTALVARASASPSSVSFGVVDVGDTSGTQTVTITSSGTSNLVIGSGATSITGSDAAMFTIDTDNCSSQTLTPASTCTILVTFTPSSTGEKSATLSLSSNDPSSPLSITLTGGEEPIPPVKTFTFWFDTSSGGTCLDSVRVIDTHIYQLPSADVACVPEGSELVGWSIPGQSWNFAPGAEVVVSGSQTFTAVALAPDIVITYDSNVSRGTKCSFGRKSLVMVPRDGNFAEWTYCTPKGYELAGWTDSTLREDATVYAPGEALPDSWFTRGTSPMNTIHLYAMWKWVG